MRIESFRKTACCYALCMVATTGVGGAPEITVTGGCEIVKEMPGGLSLQLSEASGSGQLVFLYDKEPLDLSAFSHVVLDMQSRADGLVDIKVNVASDLKNIRRSVDGRFFLEPKESEEIRMLMFRNYLPETSPWVEYYGELRALPGYQGKWLYLEPEQILRVTLDLAWSDLKGETNQIQFSHPKGSGKSVLDSQPPKNRQPLVDEAGQLLDEKWEGKLEQLSDLPKEGAADLAIYSQSCIQPGFSPYGGWLDGPRFKATGQFYTKKIDGKWWFVDPEGYLFWSLGVTGAGSGAATRLAGREHLFPGTIIHPDGPDGWRPDKFNFFDSNLKRKYGESWEQAHTAVTLGRMQQWGLNTCGAWPRGSMLTQKRVPYTLMITPQLQTLGIIDKIPDPFSEEFRASLQAKMATAAKRHAGDPWNLGIFTGNEMHWYGGIRLPLEISGLEPSVPAKREMIAFMQKKYGTVAELNVAWGSAFSSFDELQNPDGKGPQQKVFWKDLEAYFAHFCETYFALCDAALEQFFPGHLYLGCRFHSDVYGKQNPMIQRVSAKYCDVISVNGYEYAMDDFFIPPDVDCPYLVGEFHFGTGSHGVWGVGMLGARDLDHQAELYERYMKEVLNNPNFVGAHWFQWSDHAAMGREDGENYRVGFVSTVDRPYETLVSTIQKTAQQMYAQRSEGRTLSGSLLVDE